MNTQGKSRWLRVVRIGVIGSGKWGENHLKDLSKISSCHLVGLADVDERKKELADRCGVAFFKDYKEMLPHVDAVTIVTPTTTHYEIAKNCLQQGKHVLVEKPLCFDHQQAQELVDLAKNMKAVLSVGYVFRFNPLMSRVRELLPEIGDIHYIHGRYVHSTVPPRKDSGVIFNLAVHLIDFLNVLLPQSPKKIYASNSYIISKHNEDSSFVTVDYGNFSAHLEMSCCHPLKKRDMWIIGSKEKVYLDFLDQVIERHPLTVSEDKTERKETFRDPEVGKNQPLYEELKYFVHLCNKKSIGEEVSINLSAENVLTTKMCILAIQSAQKNEVQAIE